MIDISSAQMVTVKQILADQVPDCEVRVFGSRITQSAKDWSDLDLAVVAVASLGAGCLSILREAFEESDLPFRVDVLDYHSISPEFRQVINDSYEVIQPFPAG